jgi:hypothetical protein
MPDTPVKPKLPSDRYVKSLKPFIFDPTAPRLPSDFIYEYFLKPSATIVWLGREKHRKTNLVLQLAMCVALGRDFLWMKYRREKPIRAVFFDYESSTEGLQMRYDALCQAMKLSDEERITLRTNLKIIALHRVSEEGNEIPHFPAKESAVEIELGWWRQQIADNPAEMYIIDPLRSFHMSDENDSTISNLLTKIRRLFRKSLVVVTHHMRKDNFARETAVTLADDMRAWSDGARGSSAIKAAADIIVCQERVSDDGNEVVWLGAYMKDGPEIMPTPLEETDAVSFYWQMASSMPGHLRSTVELLKRQGTFKAYSDARKLLVTLGMKRATAYLHLEELKQKGFFIQGASGATRDCGSSAYRSTSEVDLPESPR